MVKLLLLRIGDVVLTFSSETIFLGLHILSYPDQIYCSHPIHELNVTMTCTHVVVPSGTIFLVTEQGLSN
jgi:hypothetical protein